MEQHSFNNIPEGFIKKWQEIADLIARIMNIPAALIMKTENEFMEVVISSKSENNPYHIGDKEHWHGLYCQTVIKTQNKLRIPNALKDKKWDKNPDIKLGMIAYLGFPINFPNKKPFGTLCVLDNKERQFNTENEKLLLQFKKVIELDLALISSLALTDKNGDHDVIQKLIDSKEKYRRIAENVTDVVWITDLEMNPTYISPSVERVIGIKPEDYLKLPIAQTYPPASLKKFREKLTEEFAKEQDSVFKKDRVFQLEVERYYSDGTIGWDAISATFLRDEQMNPIAIQGVSRDITERKKAEKALRESRNLLNTTQQIAKIGGWVWDVKNETMTWADETYYIHGMEPDEITDNSSEHIQRSLACYDKEDRPKIEAAFRRCTKESKAYSFELPITTVKGERKWINTSARAVVENGRIIKVYGHIMDITERKQAKDALIKNNKTLLQLNNFSIELSKITLDDNIEAFIAKSIKELTGAELAIFSEYNPTNKKLRVRHIEVKQGIYKKAADLLGKKADQIQPNVSDKMYQEITSKIIGFKNTLHEASFGAVSRPMGAAIQALLKAEKFIGLAYLIDGKLYGTTMLAMGKEQPVLSKQTLETFCFMVSTALQRRQAEAEQRESEERFRALHNASFGGIAIHDKGIILECNQGLSEMTGYSPEELTGMDGLLLIAPESRDMVMKNILSGYEKPYEAFGLRKNNEKYAMRLEARNVPYKGKNMRTVEFRDITERKKAEQQLT